MIAGSSPKAHRRAHAPHRVKRYGVDSSNGGNQVHASMSLHVLELSLNKERYVALLEKLIGETEFLQDSPPKFVPQEDRYKLYRSSSLLKKSSCIIS